MDEIRAVEPCGRQLDRTAILNMEHCAAFLARMIEKYGQEVLAEIEAGERIKKENEE